VHANTWTREVAVAAGVVRPGNVAAHGSIDSRSVESTVRRVAALAKDRDLVVLMIPSRQVFDAGYQVEARKQHQALVESLKVAQVRVVDPLTEFDDSENALEQFYFRYDGHWNTEGHSVASRVLLREIIQSRGDQTTQQ